MPSAIASPTNTATCSPDKLRDAFDEQLALARAMLSHIEDHNFYVDHWAHTLLWNKVREFGSLLTDRKFLADPEDMFFLRHDEARSALEELRLRWSSGAAGVPGRRPLAGDRRARARTIYQALRRWAPARRSGPGAAAVIEPVTIMHWGITTERVQEWRGDLSRRRDPHHTWNRRLIWGSQRAPPRVMFDVDELIDVRQGGFSVAPFTSTSWTPVFGRIAAAVTDAGGVMCHAAIVARESASPRCSGPGRRPNGSRPATGSASTRTTASSRSSPDARSHLPRATRRSRRRAITPTKQPPRPRPRRCRAAIG